MIHVFNSNCSGFIGRGGGTFEVSLDSRATVTEGAGISEADPLWLGLCVAGLLGSAHCPFTVAAEMYGETNDSTASDSKATRRLCGSSGLEQATNKLVLTSQGRIVG